jgi:hypothetical protein
VPLSASSNNLNSAGPEVVALKLNTPAALGRKLQETIYPRAGKIITRLIWRARK